MDAGNGDYIVKMEISKAFQDNQKPITCMDFDDQGMVCITASEDDSMHVYDAVHGRFKQLLYSKKYGVNLLKFTHRHTNILHSSTLHDDNIIRYLSLHDNKYLQYFKGHKKRVVALAMSPKSDVFLSGSRDDCIRLWDLREPNSLGAMDISGSPTLAFDPRGLIFALGLGSKIIRPYDVRQYQKGPFDIWNIFPDVDKGRQEWTDLAFSTDSKHILISTRHGIHYLVDAFSGSIVTQYRGHDNKKGLSLQAGITPDSKYVYSGSEDGVIYIWDKMTGKEIEYLEGHSTAVTNAMFNPRYMMMMSSSVDAQLVSALCDNFTLISILIIIFSLHRIGFLAAEIVTLIKSCAYSGTGGASDVIMTIRRPRIK